MAPTVAAAAAMPLTPPRNLRRLPERGAFEGTAASLKVAFETLGGIAETESSPWITSPGLVLFPIMRFLPSVGLRDRHVRRHVRERPGQYKQQLTAGRCA